MFFTEIVPSSRSRLHTTPVTCVTCMPYPIAGYVSLLLLLLLSYTFAKLSMPLPFQESLLSAWFILSCVSSSLERWESDFFPHVPLFFREFLLPCEVREWFFSADSLFFRGFRLVWGERVIFFRMIHSFVRAILLPLWGESDLFPHDSYSFVRFFFPCKMREWFSSAWFVLSCVSSSVCKVRVWFWNCFCHFFVQRANLVWCWLILLFVI